MRSPKTYGWQVAPLWPLLAKELREITSGRALWTMLLLLCPLVGYSFFQAISLYGEASCNLQSWQTAYHRWTAFWCLRSAHFMWR